MKNILDIKAKSASVRELVHLFTMFKRNMCIVCSESLQLTDFLMVMDGSQSRIK
jgi:hypothetical protein